MSIIDKAKTIVDNDRQSQYGDPVENAELQAQVASIIIGRPISALDCNGVNLAQKIVRMGRSNKEDTRVDVVGYTEIRDRLMKKEEQMKLKEHTKPECNCGANHSVYCRTGWVCFETVDGEWYSRTDDGELTRVPPKVKGRET